MNIRQEDAINCIQIVLSLGQPQPKYPGAITKAYPTAINLGREIVTQIQQLTARIEEYDKTIKGEQDAVQELEPTGEGDLPRLGGTTGEGEGEPSPGVSGVLRNTGELPLPKGEGPKEGEQE